MEFNFVDRENVSCGICNEIVPYASLFNVHLANQHPEFSDYTLEDASSYDVSVIIRLLGKTTSVLPLRSRLLLCPQRWHVLFKLKGVRTLATFSLLKPT